MSCKIHFRKVEIKWNIRSVLFHNQDNRYAYKIINFIYYVMCVCVCFNLIFVYITAYLFIISHTV